MFQHDNSIACKARCRFSDLTSIQKPWDESEHCVLVRLYHPTSMLNLANTIVAESEPVPEDWRTLFQ